MDNFEDEKKPPEEFEEDAASGEEESWDGIGETQHDPENISNERDSNSEDAEEELQEEEIIFPAEAELSAEQKRPSTFLKALLVAGLLVAAYLFGFATNPESLDKNIEALKGLSQTLTDKARPVIQNLEDSISKMSEKSAPQTTGKDSGAAPDGKNSGRKIKFWQAPMNPSFTSNKPGKGPMGMDLVPVYEDVDAGSGIRINPAMVQNIGVKTAKIKARKLTRQVRTIGRLTYDERLVNHIHTKYEGWIEKLYVDFTGQEVKEGQLLVDIYSPELVSTQEELLTAMKYQETLKTNSFAEIGKGANSLVESTIRRLQLFDVPQHQIDELMQKKKVKKTMHVHSHHRGFVLNKKANHGMRVIPGMGLYTLVDLSNIWVLADIYEYELPWIKMGQNVEMTLSYFPGKMFKGKVTYIDPFLESKTRTIKVRMEFENPDWELKPEMYANVVLKSEIALQTAAIPEEAVIHAGEKDYGVVRNSSGGFESRVLSLGPLAEGYYQVIEGVKAGEVVVTSSAFLIDSESKLKEAVGKFQGEEKKTEPAKKPEKTMEPVMKMKIGEEKNPH